MKILVAMPVYDAKLGVQNVRCLLDEQIAALVNGDELQVRFLPSCSHPAMGRNQLAQDFLESDCDRLIFLDSDITFETGVLVKLAHHSADFVGGCFRYKLPVESYPVGWIPKPELWMDENGLIEVETLPGGFLSLTRKVFSAILDANPDRQYEHFGKKSFCFFEMPYQNGHLCGEDSFFCQLWRKTGGKVFLDPDITLTHWDFNIPYAGNIGQWLKRQTPERESA